MAKWHVYDPVTFLYVETVEASSQPPNSVGGVLPEISTYYTLKYTTSGWESVVSPNYEIVNGEFQKIPTAEEIAYQEALDQFNDDLAALQTSAQAELEGLGLSADEARVCLGTYTFEP
jgi:hypothetical protein